MIKTLSALVAMAFVLQAAAEGAPVKELSLNDWNQLSLQKMDESIVYFSFTEDPGGFKDWQTQSPTEAEFLTLFDGYVEPSFPKMLGGDPIREPITVFIAKARTILNKAPNELNLKAMASLDFISAMDKQVKHIAIQPGQFMSTVAGRTDITNFRWPGCDPDGDEITRPAKEINLSVLNPPNRHWCSDKDRSVCIESCFLFSDPLWIGGIATVNLIEDNAKDFGIGFQSEVRYFLSEKELNKKVPVRQLTGVSGEVIGVLEQNIFYFNQVIQYGKTFAVFQAHPTDGHKTVLTSYFVIGLRTRSYSQHEALKDALMGRSFVNSRRGLTAGLPVYTRDMASAIVGELER